MLKTILWAAVVLAPVPAMAKAPASAWTPAATRCDLLAWPRYGLSAPVAVRAAPSLRAHTLGVIPLVAAPYEYSVQFQIVATRPGWLQIRGASDDYNENAGHPRRSVFKGQGWIEAGAAGLRVQSGKGYARPDPASRRLLNQMEWLTDVGDVTAIRGCSGEWVLLDYAITRDSDQKPLPTSQQKTGSAWFRGICTVEETTCDMPSVDGGP